MPHFSLFLDGVEIERLSLIDRVEFYFNLKNSIYSPLHLDTCLQLTQQLIVCQI